MGKFDTAIDQVTKRFLGRHLWVVTATLKVDRDRLGPFLDEHITEMLKLEEEGHVIAAGPFLDAAGANTGTGMFILSAPDRKSAERLVARDPFHREGLRDYEIREWIMNVGRWSMVVRLSSQTAEIL
ncbi:MAG: YciI family protein [Rhodospirillaceae bacterium]|nr:YciI family protein [Rhodospirillaceae bacterium]